MQRPMDRGPQSFGIRDYRDGDAPAMARLFHDAVRELGSRRYTPAQVACWAPKLPDAAAFEERALDGRVTLIAVDAADGVIAYGDLERDGHIDHLYCRPDAAGTGVASGLLEALLDRAKLAGMTKLHVDASALALGLFARKGFRLVGRRRFVLRGVAIHNFAMTLSLARPDG